MANIFNAENICLSLEKNGKSLSVLSDVSLEIEKGSIVGLIGESGSGKSMFWKSILGLAGDGRWSVTGKAKIGGEQIDFKDAKSLRKLRGSRVSIILQDPMSSFDPLMTVEQHFWETAHAHTSWSREQTDQTAKKLLERLYITDPQRVLAGYPFQCSGGMLQRIMIAIALMLSPELIIADEPTTSVDITAQREILAMLRELNEKNETSILFISHDLKAVEYIADEIIVMYAGHIVERLTSDQLRAGQARHPYTVKLMQSRPSFSKQRVSAMRGSPPELSERQSGCPFYPRCDFAGGNCKTFDMRETTLDATHAIRCAETEALR